MSENPYQVPVPNAQTGANGSTKNGAPGALKVICIICILLGGLGLLMSILGLVGLFFQSQIAEFQQTMSDPSQHDMQAKMAEAQSSYMIPNIFLTLCNLVVAPLLLIGGIGVLSKQRWGRKILSLALFSAAIFILIRTILSSFMQMQVFAIMKESLTSQLPTGAEAGTTEAILTASIYFGLALGIGMALSLAVFYFWSWRYLKKDRCQAYLSTFSA